MKCENHPTYTVNFPPIVNCPVCWLLWHRKAKNETKPFLIEVQERRRDQKAQTSPFKAR